MANSLLSYLLGGGDDDKKKKVVERPDTANRYLPRGRKEEGPYFGRIVDPPPDLVRAVEEIINTAFVGDTLAALTGGGDPTYSVHGLTPISGTQGTMAGYAPKTDEVHFFQMLETAGRQLLENTLLHEMGHRRDRRVDIDIPFDYFAKSRKQNPEWYGASSVGEHNASTFALAVQALRRIQDDPENMLDVVKAVETANPGTRNMIMSLLKEDKFRDHPLNTVSPWDHIKLAFGIGY